MKTRLNKYLADRGVGSRRHVDGLIEISQVVVNKKLATLGMQVDETDEIYVGSKLIQTSKPKEVYLAFNKPIGIITSVDPQAHDNVIDYIGYPERIFPIGRLDVASSGLLLLTNDGRLSERITHPRFDHEKEYLVTVNKPIDDTSLKQMAKGLIILDEMTKPAKVTRVDEDTFKIILTEGKNRQIRRMCEALGFDVKKLRRIRVMNIELDDLGIGKWRELTNKEVETLKKLLGMDKIEDVTEKKISFT